MNVAQIHVRPQSLVAQVAEQLAELIRSRPVDGDRQLPPERRLAEDIGVSRQVVREAIKRLEHQGLLEVRQGSGIRIIDQLHRPVSHSFALLIPDGDERLRQLLETRLAIEPDVARLAALRASDEQLAKLRTLQSQLESAPDTPAAIQIDVEFHRELAEASGNLMFRLILDSLAEISIESRRRTIGRVGKETAIDQHRKILEAVDSRDASSAAQSMREHVLTAWRDAAIELTEVGSVRQGRSQPGTSTETRYDSRLSRSK